MTLIIIKLYNELDRRLDLLDSLIGKIVTYLKGLKWLGFMRKNWGLEIKDKIIKRWLGRL
jgi:hypothetical protein